MARDSGPQTMASPLVPLERLRGVAHEVEKRLDQLLLVGDQSGRLAS